MKSNYWLDKCKKEEMILKGPDLSLEFCARKGILTRYGKKLLKEGSKFYSRLSIKDFVI